MKTENPKVFWIPFMISIVSMLTFIIAVLYNWMGEPKGVGGVFCEIGAGIIKQPANTYSNLGFVFVGWLIGWQQSKRKYHVNNNILTQSDFVSGFFASLCVLLGPGSMAMHATTTHIGGFLDMLSMYLMASFIFSFAISRAFSWKAVGFVLAFLTALLIQLYVHTLPYQVPFVGFIGSFCFGVVLIVSMVIELISFLIRKVQIELRFGIASILVLCLAFFIWNMSLTGGPWCDPDSWVQGHGAWHLLCSLSIYLVYRFYASEDQKSFTTLSGIEQ